MILEKGMISRTEQSIANNFVIFAIFKENVCIEQVVVIFLVTELCIMSITKRSNLLIFICKNNGIVFFRVCVISTKSTKCPISNK